MPSVSEIAHQLQGLRIEEIHRSAARACLIAYVIAEDGSILPVYQPAPTCYLDEEATWEDAAWY